MSNIIKKCGKINICNYISSIIMHSRYSVLLFRNLAIAFQEGGSEQRISQATQSFVRN